MPDRPVTVACTTMTEVRREIDRVDRAIVRLLAERQGYITQAGRIKQDREVVRDEARIEDVVTKVLAEAAASGASPDLIEKLYRDLVEWSIGYEFTVFDGKA